MLSRLLGTMLVVALSVLVSSRVVPGVRMGRAYTAVTVAVLFGVLNLLVGWLVKLVLAIGLLPAALLTFGLPYLFFGLLVNAVLLYLTDKLVDDLEIRSFGALMATSGLMSIAAWLLQRRL
jgi:putative membrane protein